MNSFFDEFQKFRENDPHGRGKSKFNQYYKKLSIRKNGDFTGYLLTCSLAKQLSNNEVGYCCNIKMGKENADIYLIESDISLFMRDFIKNLPEEVVNAIEVIRNFSDSQAKQFL